MGRPPTTASGYIAVWQHVLGGWLSWPEHRIASFIDRYRSFLDTPHSVIYSKLPIRVVAYVLLSSSLRRRCNLGELGVIELEIERAVEKDDCCAHCLPDYDWDAARKRVEIVLKRHGAALPPPEELTWYEEEELQKRNT